MAHKPSSDQKVWENRLAKSSKSISENLLWRWSSHDQMPATECSEKLNHILQVRGILTDYANSLAVRSQSSSILGESEGLEFLFDQCVPDRPVKGAHYVTPRKTYRHNRSITNNRTVQNGLEKGPPLPPRPVQEELMRCFFHYVYPVLPIVDVKEVLEGFEHDPKSVRPLLLWSIFFAALNVSRNEVHSMRVADILHQFIDKDILRMHRLPPRKLLKEQYYHNAKVGMKWLSRSITYFNFC